MPSVKDILKIKGSQLYKIGLNASVQDAAVLMNDNRIGALVVVKGQSDARHLHGARRAASRGG